jgi:ribonuclease P protein component
LKNELPYNRICFTFTGASKGSKGFGNAVARNRARRLGREAFRLLNSRLCGGSDLILLVYPETNMVLSGRIKQFESLFIKAGLLK